jgi:AcrR family transcriptional regulator
MAINMLETLISNRADGSQTKAYEKRAAILQAAHNVILRYGFSRVTMDDIAKECRISRPALYLIFKNKQEIYRATTRVMCDLALDILKRELAKDGTPKQVLFNGLKFGLLDMMAELASSTHGGELLDMKGDLSDDIISEFVEEMAQEIGTHFASLSKNSPFPPDMMAMNLMLWLEGMKAQIKEPAEREKALGGFLAMQFAALEMSKI